MDIRPIRSSSVALRFNRPKSLYSKIVTSKDSPIKFQFCIECFDLLDIFNTDNKFATFASCHVTNDVLSRDKTWTLLGCTYVVKDNANPQYHEKEFEINDVLADEGSILIQVYALHPSNGMPVCIGSCQVTVRDMLSSDLVVKKLQCGASEKGTVVMYMKIKKDGVETELPDLCEATYAVPASDISPMSETTDQKNSSFKDFLGNCTRQRYHIDLRSQRRLQVSEQMYEVSTSFTLPALYLRMLCEREHQNLLILKDMDEGFSAETISVAVVSRTTKIAQYRDELGELGRSSKYTFKKSEWKGHTDCKWAPINLHGQVLEVNTVDPTISSIEPCRRDNYVFMTVGAMAAHWDKFKYGGLQSLLGNADTTDGQKFAHRRELYRALRKFEDIINSHSLGISDGIPVRDIVSDLITLSREEVPSSAAEQLQRTLGPEKQLEFIKLTADMERILKNTKVTSKVTTKVTSKETVSSLCVEYSLHLQRAIVWSIAQIELDNREHFLGLLNRYECCFSQLVAAIVTGFMITLCYKHTSKIFAQQLKDRLVPVMFESLLSTHGDEMSMLEDMLCVMQNMDQIDITIFSSSEGQVKVSSVIGDPFSTQVTISAPTEIFSRLPQNIQRGDSIKLLGLFYSHGINEQQTIAYKMAETGLQDKICEQFLVELQNYIMTYVMPNESLFDFKVSNSLMANVEKLNALFKITKKNKSSDFLALCEQIGRDIDAIRFTSCKSAKDRTSMSITYEYCNILCDRHEFHTDDIPGILEQFRRDGTRYHNTFKNIGSYKYCFNKLQCMMLPGIYRPPHGTYGEGAQQS